MKRTIKPLRWYQQLRWKLSLLYIAATIGVVLMGLWITQVSSYFTYMQLSRPDKLHMIMVEEARDLGSYGSSSQISVEALTLWLTRECEKLKVGNGRWQGLSFYSNALIYAEVTNPIGVVHAAIPQQPMDADQARVVQSIHDQLIARAVGDAPDSGPSVVRESRHSLAGAVPIIDDNGRLRGALYMRVEAPFNWLVNWQHVAHGLAKPLIMIVTLSMIGGLLFGVVTARHLVNRLDGISKAAQCWAHGDFTAVAEDCQVDELGQLSRQLNFMLEDLRGFLAVKQELATLEERNRLARDLHDTVKQQTFALAMQIGAAQSMLNGDNPKVSERLAEAENLAQQVQHELVSIIEKLRPQNRNCKEFDLLLREHVATWSRQSGVVAEVKSDQPVVLPTAVEQAFFRILQEALANVYRHSGASHALVQLNQSPNGKVTLSVTDDGDGFDAAKTNGGLGLKSMRERAEALPGGWLDVETRLGKGVRIIAGFDPRSSKL